MCAGNKPSAHYHRPHQPAVAIQVYDSMHYTVIIKCSHHLFFGK